MKEIIELQMRQIKVKEEQKLFEKFNKLSADDKNELLKEVYVMAHSNIDNNVSYTDNVLDMIKTILTNKVITYSQWKSLSMYKKNNLKDSDIRKQLGIQ